MGEFTVNVYIEYKSDVPIELSRLSLRRRIKLIVHTILKKDYVFEDIDLFYDGTTLVEIEPDNM